MSNLTLLGIAWFVVTTAVQTVMWAAQVHPDQAVSNLSVWATRLGVRDVPPWLTAPSADRWVRRWGKIVLAILLFVGVGGALAMKAPIPVVGMAVCALGLIGFFLAWISSAGNEPTVSGAAGSAPPEIRSQEKTRPYYSSAEIEKMLGALQEFDKAIENNMRSASASIGYILRTTQNITQWHADSFSKGTKPTLEYIYAASKQISDGSEHIQRTLRDPELRLLKDKIDGVVTDEKKSIETMLKALGNLYSDLGMFPTVSFDRLAILRRDFEDVDRALPPFNIWISESSAKIKAKNTEIRGWKS